MYCLYNNFLNVISLLRLDKTVIFVCLLFYYHHQAEYSMSKYISTHSPLRIYLNLRIQNQHSLLCMLCFVVFLLKVLHRYTDLTACSENEGFAVVCLTETGRLVPCKQWMVVRKAPELLAPAQYLYSLYWDHKACQEGILDWFDQLSWLWLIK